jgi:ribosome maturation protein SDO1
VALIDPGKYKIINEMLQADTKGRAQIEIMSLREQEEGDEKF